MPSPPLAKSSEPKLPGRAIVDVAGGGVVGGGVVGGGVVGVDVTSETVTPAMLTSGASNTIFIVCAPAESVIGSVTLDQFCQSPVLGTFVTALDADPDVTWSRPVLIGVATR